MKSAIRTLAMVCIFSLSFLLMGCPVSSSYPLGEKNAEKIDSRLTGTWKNDSDSLEATRVTLRKESDYTYNLTVDEKGPMFMAESTNFKAWITKIENQSFLVLQEVSGGNTEEKYYVYQYEFKGDKLNTHDITLLVGGTDAITSIPAYRQEVRASMLKNNFLGGSILWHR